MPAAIFARGPSTHCTVVHASYRNNLRKEKFQKFKFGVSRKRYTVSQNCIWQKVGNNSVKP